MVGIETLKNDSAMIVIKSKFRKGGIIMFKIPDFGIWFAYLLCILSGLACVVYGLLNWNKGDNSDNQIKEELQWEKNENEVEANL